MDNDTHLEKPRTDEHDPGGGTAPPRRKILVISPWASRWSLGSGAGVSDDHYFIEKFIRRGYELHFVAPRGDGADETPAENVSVYEYPNFFRATGWMPTVVKRILWPLLFNAIVTVTVLRTTRRIRPDFVLGHSHYSSFPGFVTRELMRIPSGVKLFGVMDLVHTEWSAWTYYTKNLEQILALKIPQDVWIILDDGTKGREAALRHGVPEKKIRWLPNGVNIEWMNQRFDGSPVRQRLGMPEGAVVVLFLARLVASKRPEMVLHAIPRVLQRVSDPCVFVFAGDGPSRGRCEALARELGVTAEVRFTGAIPHREVPEIMAASDVFVSTSNLTNAAIPTCEALVCGLPVVAFDVGNTRSLVQDGYNGIVVDDADVLGLAEAIAGLANDPAVRRRMAERAKGVAREKLTGWDRRTDLELEIIDQVIEQNR